MEKTNVPYDTISRLSVSSQSIFSKCCCCIPLRIGCFILGYLNLVIHVFQILALIVGTTYVGLTTHGFDHVDTERPPIDFQDTRSSVLTEDPEIEKKFLTGVAFFLAVIIIISVAWLIINIACLVGLHKRRPGPIRVYVTLATIRLVFAIIGFIHLIMTNKAQPHAIISYSIDLGIIAYFIFVYYIYAVQLERENALKLAHPAPVSNVFIYPTKLDKSHLVA